MFRILALSAVAALATSTHSVAQTNAQGVTVNELAAAINGQLNYNGEALTFTPVSMEDGGAYLATVASTGERLAVGGIGCEPAAGARRCQGVAFLHLRRGTLNASAVNTFNASSNYAKLGVADGEFIRLTTEHVVYGGVTPANLRAAGVAFLARVVDLNRFTARQVNAGAQGKIAQAGASSALASAAPATTQVSFAAEPALAEKFDNDMADMADMADQRDGMLAQ